MVVLLQNKEEKLKHAALKILYEKEALKILFEKEDTQEKVDDQKIISQSFPCCQTFQKNIFSQKSKKTTQ